MVNTNVQSLQNGAQWNIKQRDAQKRVAAQAATAAVRAEALRNVRRYQRNIDQINQQLRSVH
jgi:hypothetical protein